MSTASTQKLPAAAKAAALAQKPEAPAKAPASAAAPKSSAPAPKAAAKAAPPAPEGTKAPAASKAAVKTADPAKTAASASEATKAAPAAKAAKAPIKLAKAPAAKAPTGPENGENGGEAKPKKARHQVTVVLGLDVSQARVTSHLKNNLGDAESEALIKELRGQLKAAKDAGDDAQAEELKAQINEEAKKLVRISSDAPIAVATAADVMVKELIRHAMLQAHAADRRMVEVCHIHNGQTSELSTWPLFRNLPSFEGYSEEAEEELKRKRAAANKEAKEAREAKKGAAEQRPAAANGAAPAPAKGGAKGAAKAPAAPAEEPADEEPGDLEPHTGKTTFFTYVEGALKKVKGEGPDFRNMRVSNRLREYCADLITELIVRFSRLARIMVMSVMDVRTLTADHIVSIVRVLMVDEHRADAAVEDMIALIKEKLKAYHEHIKAERQNKMSLLPEEKRKELEQKRAEQENLRKRKAAELAQKRAEEAASRAAELAEEVAQLPAAEPVASEDGDGADGAEEGV